MNIPVDLSQELSPKTLRCVLQHAEDFGLDPYYTGGLCWLVELLKLIPDRTYHFPTGKFHTIETLETILTRLARRQVELRYGNVNANRRNSTSAE